MTPRALWFPLLFASAACSRGEVEVDAKAPPDDLAVAPDGDDSDGPLVNRPDVDPKGFDVTVVDDVDLLDVPAPPRDAPPPPDASPPPDEPVVTPTCGAGEVPCGARCVVIDSNPLHCGRCGNACAPDQECLVGTCSARCPSGASRCGLSCVDLAADDANCGTCGTRCPAGMRCAGGACELACAAGQLACGGRCVDPASDAAHCGACGRACPATQRCRAGACVPTGPGAPCGSNADCDPTAPTCFPNAIGWQGGYCTRQCTRDDCPAGSLCISDGSANFCLRTCTAASGCRAGYLCRSVGGTDSVCYPSCTANPLALCGASSCNAATGICRFVCASSGDCTAGSTCNAASPRRCTCSASTDCGPGRTCLTRYGYCGCNSDAACGPDALCDPTYGICRAR